MCQEDTLKDHIQDALKELRKCTSNEEGFKKVVLQIDQVLAQFKAMDGHATWNVMRR
jgi:hypothetical protein